MTPGGLRVPTGALAWRFSRASGPGGQSVNTADSRAELRADLGALEARHPAVAARVRERLGDEVRVVASTERSQLLNRAEARRRLAERLDAAARPEPRRRRTRVPRRAKEARLEDKRRRAERKAGRRWRGD
ncbi:MAG: aminoacyl-tRNA hydrolase [Actinobacteria bacterium]|nr:aminoacyl-tRNA hydrolase [Actinomycetota bacterium]